MGQLLLRIGERCSRLNGNPLLQKGKVEVAKMERRNCEE